MRRARLILLGDDAQLPSVEAGAVLRDAVASLPRSVARLTTVHRQAGAAAGLDSARRTGGESGRPTNTRSLRSR